MVMIYSFKINEDSKSKIEIFGDQWTGLMLRSNISYLSIRRKLRVFSTIQVESQIKFEYRTVLCIKILAFGKDTFGKPQ